MEAKDSIALLERAEVIRVGTVDNEGWPYVVPLSFVYRGGRVYFHHTSEASHLSSNLKVDPRVCIEVDDPGPVFIDGETGCDVSRVFYSVIAFGKASLVTDTKEKEEFFNRLMTKYADPSWSLSPGYPKLETTHVFQVDVETITGKR